MDRNVNSGNSWADQWDYNDPNHASEAKNKESGGGVAGKYGKKVGAGLEKTKKVTFTSAKKVKEGAKTGIQWVKEKYNKRSQKN